MLGVPLRPAFALVVLLFAVAASFGLLLFHLHRLRCRNRLGHGGLRPRLLAAARDVAADKRTRRAADTGADDRAIRAADLLADRRTGGPAGRTADDRAATTLALRADSGTGRAAERAAYDAASSTAGLLSDRSARRAADAAADGRAHTFVGKRKCRRASEMTGVKNLPGFDFNGGPSICF